MKQATLNDLYHACALMVKKGFGERKLIVPNDNEGNGYHGVYFLLTPITEENKLAVDYMLDNSDETDPMKLMVVG